MQVHEAGVQRSTQIPGNYDKRENSASEMFSELKCQRGDLENATRY